MLWHIGMREKATKELKRTGNSLGIAVLGGRKNRIHTSP
jgi:hypothetical protein